jgi:hypothetical protein
VLCEGYERLCPGFPDEVVQLGIASTFTNQNLQFLTRDAHDDFPCDRQLPKDTAALVFFQLHKRGASWRFRPPTETSTKELLP